MFVVASAIAIDLDLILENAVVRRSDATVRLRSLHREMARENAFGEESRREVEWSGLVFLLLFF